MLGDLWVNREGSFEIEPGRVHLGGTGYSHTEFKWLKHTGH